MRRTLLWFAVALWPALAPAASAAPVVVAREQAPLADGPRFAGDRVVWARYDPRRRIEVVDAAGARLGGPQGALSASLSESLWGFLRTDVDDRDGIVLGVTSARQPRSKDGAGREDLSQTYAVGGGALAARGPSCMWAPAVAAIAGGAVLSPAAEDCRAVVVTRADGSVLRLPIAAGETRETQLRSVTLAGHFASWSTSTSVVVYDLDLGAESYRLALPRDERNIVDLSPGGDVVATTSDDAPPAAAFWGSVAEPFAHPLALSGARLVQVRWAGTRLLVWSASGGQGRGVLDLRERDGSVAWRIAEGVVSDQFLPRSGSDSAGARVAWARPRCTGADIVVSTFGDPVQRASPAVRCPLELARRPRIRGSRIEIVLRRPPPGGSPVWIGVLSMHQTCARSGPRPRCEQTPYGLSPRSRYEASVPEAAGARRYRLDLTIRGRRLLARRAPRRVEVVFEQREHASGYAGAPRFGPVLTARTTLDGPR